jgi:hypothetical protein
MRFLLPLLQVLKLLQQSRGGHAVAVLVVMMQQ